MTPLALTRFKAKARRLNDRYAEQRAQWLADHPKIPAVSAQPDRAMTADELRK